ncbi:MAG: beta-galactosidase trimerization domain-containing protein [Vicinamibacterales bacterium]|nr:beta-galactosidase trimerization domain-containing protein [Vicinamibacterales bacterium]
MDERDCFCQDARRVPIGACLHSVENWRAAQASEGLPQIPSAYGALRGAAEMLADNNIHFDILPENMLGRLGEYEFLVLPDVGYVSDDTADAIRRYVRNGGCLVATGRTSLADRFGRPQPPSLTDLLGVQYVEDSPYSVSYLELSQEALKAGVPDMPLLVNAQAYGQTSSPPGARRERSLRCQPSDGTDVWATCAEPCLEPDFPAGRHIYHAHSPPDHRSQWPAIMHRRVGGGRVLYVAAPLLRAYAISHSPSLRRLLANALGLPRAFRVDGPAGVETVLNEQDGRWLVHLIPRRTESVESSQIAEGSAIDSVTIRVRKPGARSARIEPDGGNLECRLEGDLLTVRVPPFHEWTILSIQ